MLARSFIFWRDERGISSVEYGLLLGLVAAGIVISAAALAIAISDNMTDAAQCVDGTTC